MEGTGGYKGTLTLWPATPSEYVRRMDAQNEVFGDDTRIEGLTKVNGRVGIATSQRAIEGEVPAVHEIDSMMDGRGFKKVGAAVMSHDNLIGKTWYDPASRTLVGDVKPDNFKKQPGGRIQALDLIVHRLPPESDIHDLLTGA